MTPVVTGMTWMPFVAHSMLEPCHVSDYHTKYGDNATPPLHLGSLTVRYRSMTRHDRTVMVLTCASSAAPGRDMLQRRVAVQLALQHHRM